MTLIRTSKDTGIEYRLANTRLRAENQRLRNALEFYADTGSYEGDYGVLADVLLDYGRKAREALTNDTRSN